jgi:hypothetical protein
MVTWQANRDLLASLWPQYQPTDAERALFAEALSGLDQDRLQRAVKLARRESSNDFKPSLHAIEGAYLGLTESERPRRMVNGEPLPSEESIIEDARRCRERVDRMTTAELALASDRLSKIGMTLIVEGRQALTDRQCQMLVAALEPEPIEARR